MVSLRKKVVGTKEYYYLGHSMRSARGVEVREKYLGTRVPENLEKAKAEFLAGIYKERFYPRLDLIKKNYSRLPVVLMYWQKIPLNIQARIKELLGVDSFFSKLKLWPRHRLFEVIVK
ncbi:hypothetical protein HY993_00525, partial [Candidatus Micrarchaeota archaeon]|nr:hypothetical protein [Candidatus Micrarchaeota archaeon]